MNAKKKIEELLEASEDGTITAARERFKFCVNRKN